MHPGNIWSAGDGISYFPPKFAIAVVIIVTLNLAKLTHADTVCPAPAR